MRNKIIEIDIEDLAFNGQAVGHLDGKVVFVKGGLPGERVEARITKTKRSYSHAKITRIITKAPERIAPICRHYDICGGCIWQDLAYERQLYYKQKQVSDCLKHLGKFEDVEITDIKPSPDLFFYRNKMEYSFHTASEQKSPRGFVLGLHERGRFDFIFDVEECHLQSEISNQMINAVRDDVESLQIPAYDLVRHKGFLRFLIIREAKNTGQSMMVIVTGEGDFVKKSEFISGLIEKFPQLTTIAWVVNTSVTNIARGTLQEILHGPGYIEEEIMGRRFRISPESFFQTNSRQTEHLYRAALELAELKKDDMLLDLYCGAGTIGLCAADKVSQVIGIEIEESAVADARLNAEINNIDNCRFFAGDARKVLESDDLRETKFDIVINDPPRAGMHPKALKRLIEIDAPRLVYISCNPATFSRDAVALREAGYNLVKVIPFDMFPHTMHIELAARFTKNN